MPAAQAHQSSDDRCPGSLRLHAADDGYVARIRVVGGRLTAPQLRGLADLADALGDGVLHLTSRGNLQVRGLSADSGAALATALQDLGMLPSLAHDRVRNIVASPRGGPEVEAVLTAFDEAIVADSRLTALSGRFLFAIDDGSGDVLGLESDLAVQRRPNGAWHLAVAGRLSDVAGDPVALLIAAAHRFLDLRDAHAPGAWRVRDLGEYAASLAGGTLGASTSDSSAPPPSTSDGSVFVEAWVPLGSAPTNTWRTVAGLVDDLRLSPWRSVVLVDPVDPEGARISLQDKGFGITDQSVWARTSACIGAPGCAKSRTDVRRDAEELAQAHPGRTLHVAGCERRCGHPLGPRIELVAQPGGDYLIEELT